MNQAHQMGQGASERFHPALDWFHPALEQVQETLEQVHRALAAVRGEDLPWANPAIDPPSFAYNR